MPGFLVPLLTREAFQLPDAGETTLGRRSTCSIVCADETVSGLHCTIFSLGPDDFELEDASRNGTYWNDARLLKGERVKLKAGDILSLSPTARPGTCFRLVDSFDSFDSFHSYPAVTKNGDKTSALRRMSAMEQDEVSDSKAKATEVVQDGEAVPGSERTNGSEQPQPTVQRTSRPLLILPGHVPPEAAQTEFQPVLMRSKQLPASSRRPAGATCVAAMFLLQCYRNAP